MMTFSERVSTLVQPDQGQAAISITVIDRDGFAAWEAAATQSARTLARAADFAGKDGELLILPGNTPDDWSAVAGVADAAQPDLWCLAKAASSLPEGSYRLADGMPPGKAVTGWLLAQYRFDRYRPSMEAPKSRVLLTPDPARIGSQLALAKAVALVRDLVNTPAADMGPEALEAAAAALAKAHKADITVTRGDALLQGYPMVAAVGRAAAAHHAPRMIELGWGNPDHPHVAIIGKGVCFDSGGLDIKPSSAMLLMKKDMGGAAHALALAQLVMTAGLKIRLSVLIPAVENAIAGDAMRPGDVLATRAGLSVEIGNTDAEGRLVLADALTRAGELGADMIIDFATLTGAARVALGPEIPALFCNDEAMAQDFADAAIATADPVWRMPLYAPYADMIKSDIADINNSGEGGMAGAITAALFLQRFVPEDTAWAHLDTYAWRGSARPGRPKGGEALGLRASFAMLQARFGSAIVK